ncbi:hypothetical protein [Arcticibacter tournemirensis]
MKKIVSLLALAFLFVACGSNDLDKETALKILKEQGNNSKVIDFEIYTADPVQVRKVLDAKLEEEGLVKVQRTQKLADLGKPLISFTEKAKPYLLPVSEEDKKSKVQRVKVAEAVVANIVDVQSLEGEKRAVVKYETSFQKITPFARLYDQSFAVPDTGTANFTLYDDGWKLEK